MWDRFRTTRAGEIARSEAWHRVVFAEQGIGQIHALHADGYATWKVEPKWNDGHPAHDFRLATLAAVTPDAHAARCGTRSCRPTSSGRSARRRSRSTIRCRSSSLTSAWSARPTSTTVCGAACHDVQTCFGARTYGTDEDVVVEVDGTRWRIGAGGVALVRSRPDLVTDQAGLGALLLGGVAPTTLAAGRRLEPRSGEALRRADALFLTHPAPYSQTGF